MALDSEQFHRLEELFHHLDGLDDAARRPLLTELRAEDPSLCAELERMLAIEAGVKGSGEADPGAGRGFAAGLTGAAATPVAQGSERIGPYRLVRVLGEGGMGVVYEALQEEPVRRRVALKVIRWGLDSKSILGRFESERQALALMSHPNIARVYDTGTTADGRPYFAMELVDGAPIHRYCDEKRLTTRERLELFVDVCGAVQHAHRKGVIHRDLKPSNLLVAEEDGRATVKVIDFGIAKAIAGRPADASRLTRRGDLLGTPAYMSPEQAGLGTAVVDTRSDVYSLGVVLYELLVGELPLSASGPGGDTPEEIRRHIERLDAPRPSSRLQPATAATAEVAAARRTKPAVLARTLRGDLDWIVLKAVAREPDERYESPAALAADLGRALRDEPVEAGPPSLGYRMGKLVRRHRLAVAVAAVVAVAIALGGVLATVGMVRARRAEAAAVLARAESERRAMTAQEVTDFLVDVFAAPDPLESTPEDLDARRLLARGVERIDELGEEPLVQAELLATMGRVYTNLGLYEEALPLLERSLEVRRRSVGRADLETADTLGHLGMLFVRLQDLESAKRAHAECLKIRERLLPPTHTHVAAALNNLAIVHLHLGETADALPLLERSLRLAETNEGPDSEAVASVLVTLGHAQVNEGDLATARTGFERAVRIFERELGPDHPNVGTVLNNLSYAQNKLGHYREALDAQLRVVEIEAAHFDADHPRLAEGRLNLAARYWAVGLWEEGIEAAEAALRTFESKLGPEHVRVASTLGILADLRLGMGDLEGAERASHQALEVARRIDHPRAAGIRWRREAELARLARLRGHPAAARRRCERALAEADGLGVAADERAWCGLQLAWIVLAAGDPAEAAALYTRATAELPADRRCAADGPTAPMSRAAYLAAAGDLDAAFAFLALAADGGPLPAWSAANPDLAPLRADPRYAQLRARAVHAPGHPAEVPARAVVGG